MLQEQLERLATDAAKRLRLLKNKVKIIDPEQVSKIKLTFLVSLLKLFFLDWRIWRKITAIKNC